LVLKKNPNYGQAGHPLLDNLTFSSVGSDQTALDAVQTGQANGYQGLSEPLVLAAKSAGLTVTTIPSTLGPDMIQLNTTTAPFNNISAREALYYATDPAAINTGLEAGTGQITESMSGAGDLFDETTVPSYRTYDLAKAQALVKQLGGLTVNLESIDSTATDALMIALKSEWAAAGIDTTIVPQTLEAQIQTYENKSWHAALSTTGGCDRCRCSACRPAPRSTPRSTSTSATGPTRRSSSTSPATTSHRRACPIPG
jgi:peptide/nickel transport system substrate-binding protein